ncbi:MAG: putative glycoside hydrolase [Patescibacteria group bacterium]
MSRKKKKLLIVLAVILIGFGAVFAYSHFVNNDIHYVSGQDQIPDNTKDSRVKNANDTIAPVSSIAQAPVTHIETPSVVKALYASSWVAGSSKYINPLIELIDATELNAIVIDVKDSTGRISFPVSDPVVEQYGSVERRISDIRGLTHRLHQKNIYIIGRISVFQDPYLAPKKPEWAITKKSDGKVWKDKKGLSFLDPANKEVRAYVAALARDAYEQGFDEINFDYIRYPSDGNITDINYHLTDGKTRADNLESFFAYLSGEMKKEKNIPISADLFGLTTELSDDMGIGQVWEKALPHFDYLSPMIYPSHYPAGTHGYKNPAAYPYEIIDAALKGAIAKTKAAGQDIKKIRPWLQDFNLGATYTKEMVRAQIKASNDNGITSWMLWDPKNKYTPAALEVEKGQ